MRTVTSRTITGKVNLDGTPGVAGPWTSRKSATGQYVVTMPPDVRLLSAVTAPFNFVVAQVNPSAPPPNAFNVNTSAPATGAGTDGGFWFSAEVAA